MHGFLLSCSQLAFSFLSLFIYPAYRMTLLTVGWVCLHQSTVKITPHRHDYRPTWPRKSLTKTLPRWFCTGHFDKAKQHKYHRDGYIVKSTCCSCIGPRLSAQQQVTYNHLQLQSRGRGVGGWGGVFCRYQARTGCKNIHASNTHTEKIKSHYYFLKCWCFEAESLAALELNI